MSAVAYVEHVAVWVKDIHWHIHFFQDVLGLTLRDVEGPPENPRQVWTLGGLQFMSDPNYNAPEGRLGHIGIMCEDVDAALQAAHKYPVTVMPQGPNWLRLPDGLAIELLQASKGAVAQAQAVNPRA